MGRGCLPDNAERGFEQHPGQNNQWDPANITLVDPRDTWTVDPAATASRSNNSPFGGIELPGRAVATFLRGTPTYLDARFEGLFE